MHNPPVEIKFVIPATPGFFSVSLLFDEHGKPKAANKEAIVGWAIDQYNFVCPVTPGFLDVEGDVTLCPDGTVQSSIGSWESIELWLAEQSPAES